MWLGVVRVGNKLNFSLLSHFIKMVTCVRKIAETLKKTDAEETGYYDIFSETPFGLLMKMVLLSNKSIWRPLEAVNKFGDLHQPNHILISSMGWF